MSFTSVLVTGATGLVGYGIIQALLARNTAVRGLVRDVERARRLLPERVELVAGDIATGANLREASAGVKVVFHAAGMPEQWQRDESIFDRVNRGGTANVLAAARESGVERVVYTSTMDVFAAPPGGTLTEQNVDPHPKATAYERSKQAAEREAEKIAELGLDVVYVNPGAIYGPSPILTTLNGFFERLLDGKVPLLPPGGMPLAYVDGVVAAHLAAAEKGRAGERYLVADEHVSMSELAREILRAAAPDRAVPKTAPAWLMRALANGSAPLARTFGFRPLLAPGELSLLLWDIRVDAGKARRELGFVPTPAREGIAKTVAFLRNLRESRRAH